MGHVVTDGNRIGYTVEGSGADVVLIHGITENSHAWGRIPAELAHTHRVIQVDLRGHGTSDPAGGYGLDDMADDVASVVDALGATEPIVVGHSLGGFVATVYGARHPCRAIVNLDQPLALAAFKDQLTQVEPLLRSDAFEGVILSMFDGFMAELPDDEQARLAGLRRPDREVVLGIWSPVFRLDVAGLDRLVHELIPGVPAPYLAIHGADPGPEYRAWLATSIPHATLEVWPGGHYPHLFDRDRLVERVRGAAA